MENSFGFTRSELSVLRKLNSPAKIQDFIETQVGYNKEKDGETCRSPRRVLRDRLAHCMEGALFGAAALRVNGFAPLLLDLVAERNRDDDHVLAVFKLNGCWGAIAKSNYTGLKFREPLYRSVRELVMSYFEDYFNPEGEKTLRAYSRPVNISRFDRIDWMTTEQDLYLIGDYLNTVSHYPVVTSSAARRLRMVDPLQVAAGMLGGAK
ncbi:MAG TPA: hypothetical protein VFC63_27695 [Blastocatellia bacterium]|nr:hypothetical protein [Blastocatellia bacterium]